MRIFRNNSHGNLYAVDYSIGDDPVMHRKTLKIVNPVSIEGHINSELAEHHSVPVAEIKVSQIVRHGE